MLAIALIIVSILLVIAIVLIALLLRVISRHKEIYAVAAAELADEQQAAYMENISMLAKRYFTVSRTVTSQARTIANLELSVVLLNNELVAAEMKNLDYELAQAAATNSREDQDARSKNDE